MVKGTTVSYLRLAAYDWTQQLVAMTDLYLNCERGFQCAIDASVLKIVVVACDYSDPIAVLSISHMRIFNCLFVFNLLVI